MTKDVLPVCDRQLPGTVLPVLLLKGPVGPLQDDGTVCCSGVQTHRVLRRVNHPCTVRPPGPAPAIIGNNHRSFITFPGLSEEVQRT